MAKREVGDEKGSQRSCRYKNRTKASIVGSKEQSPSTEMELMMQMS